MHSNTKVFNHTKVLECSIIICICKFLKNIYNVGSTSMYTIHYFNEDRKPRNLRTLYRTYDQFDQKT